MSRVPVKRNAGGYPLAARGATASAFERRCIPSGGVAPPSNIPDILGRRALPVGRIAALGATMELHHGLLGGAGASASAGVFAALAILVRPNLAPLAAVVAAFVGSADRRDMTGRG